MKSDNCNQSDANFFFFFFFNFPSEAEEMLKTKDYFKHGQLDKEGLVPTPQNSFSSSLTRTPKMLECLSLC